ncbi:MAG: hypothetical protein HOK72_12885 [Flavobacteriales bacterium]|nr:hypothetical protein [Flavobacteriales bacterium]
MENYTADILSKQDYYPFGMVMPGRSVTPTVYLVIWILVSFKSNRLELDQINATESLHGRNSLGATFS